MDEGSVKHQTNLIFNSSVSVSVRKIDNPTADKAMDKIFFRLIAEKIDDPYTFYKFGKTSRITYRVFKEIKKEKDEEFYQIIMNHMCNNLSMNINRINRINRKKQMKKRHHILTRSGMAYSDIKSHFGITLPSLPSLPLSEREIDLQQNDIQQYYNSQI